MDCEKPEVVFLKENDYEIIKDICIAGEVRSLNECSVENCELDHNNISDLLTYGLAKSSTELPEELLLYISTKGDAFSNHDCIKDDIKLSEAENKLMEDKADDAVGKDDIVSKKQVFSSQQMNNFSPSKHSDSCELRNEPKTDKDPRAETNLENPSFRSKAENEDNSNGLEETRNGSDSLLNMILREKSKANAEVESMSENSDNIPKGLAVTSLSRESTVGLQEYQNPSFSAASPPAGLSAFSGSIPYSSDSISQRSNSTTSTRSFAFPILTAEWNDSPIRMAEADRRHMKKPRCWPVCFNCCRI